MANSRQEPKLYKLCAVRTSSGFIALLCRNGMLYQNTLPRSSKEEAIADITAGFNECVEEDVTAFADLPVRLRLYFEGMPISFADIPIDFSCYAPFYATILMETQRIRYGEAVTYGSLAQRIGTPKAARAVGNAMARNKTPIIIPCHRVLAKGGIGGYSMGLEWKKRLLEMEGIKVK